MRIRHIAPREGEHQIVTSAVLEKACDLVLDFVDGADDRDVGLARKVDIVGEAVGGNRAEIEPQLGDVVVVGAVCGARDFVNFAIIRGDVGVARRRFRR